MPFIIDNDIISDGEDNGYTGPRGTSPAEKLKDLDHYFRMYDDDGELYYEGRSDDDSSFEPLDYYGEPNAGCTEIRYLNRKTKVYETL